MSHAANTPDPGHAFIVPEISSGLSSARKTVRWTVFSEEGHGSGKGVEPPRCNAAEGTGP